MNIEDAIAQNTKAVQENTAVLREILASASAEALTTPAPKKKAKVKKEAPLAVIADEMQSRKASAPPQPPRRLTRLRSSSRNPKSPTFPSANSEPS